ncbi:DUF2946 family protein [Hydrogenophaga defluvii]|uniref:DUF2946 family protein n=1 Tax=Hydrogenophaga defluvii TaxID=249410 RepID=A0ABW2SCN8_9BURK
MDEMVKAALAKWPNVPDCYGWLGLDSRGQWFMRDDRAQACGPFAGLGANEASKGSLLRHDKLIDFIGRNYEADTHGQWFFQNGPQRVYVELEQAPWVWRVDDAGTVQSHTGRAAVIQAVFVDEAGHVLLDTDLGLGLVHTQDVGRVAELIERGQWPEPTELASATLPSRFGFVLSPAEAKQAT